MSSRKTIPRDNSFIHYHGRWDSTYGSWWAGSGLKLNISNLHSLALVLGQHTNATAGVSIDYDHFSSLELHEGRNEVYMDHTHDIKDPGRTTTVRIIVQSWEKTRMVLDSLEVNEDARLVPYTTQKLVLQFIGDSLSAGQYNPQGIIQSWTSLVGEKMKAEARINALPGAALSDIVSYRNHHGLSFQFFQTEDSGYAYTNDHNYLTHWDFEREAPLPDVVVILLGNNDNGQKVPPAVFAQNYMTFLAHLREIYEKQLILFFSPFGRPQADGTIEPVYKSEFEDILRAVRTAEDFNTHMIDGYGWLSKEDVIDPSSNRHPTVEGEKKIAGLFQKTLSKFGVYPQEKWENEIAGAL